MEIKEIDTKKHGIMFNNYPYKKIFMCNFNYYLKRKKYTFKVLFTAQVFIAIFTENLLN